MQPLDKCASNIRIVALSNFLRARLSRGSLLSNCFNVSWEEHSTLLEFGQRGAARGSCSDHPIPCGSQAQTGTQTLRYTKLAQFPSESKLERSLSATRRAPTIKGLMHSLPHCDPNSILFSFWTYNLTLLISDYKSAFTLSSLIWEAAELLW